ncbi:capsid protein [Clostridium sp. Mt-5]|uniref:Capsid protein n=1 Tax=Clostridium moutaii TaxID=3240932 RepID=A0ABV4BQY5_9CLOT
MGWFKNMIMKMLNVMPAPASPITIQEPLSFEATVLRNRIWYRGEPSELDQFFKNTVIDLVSRSRFWAAVPSAKLNIRKMHSGMPSIIVEALADIVISGINTIEVNDEAQDTIWQEISEDNKFDKLIKNTIIDTLVAGDGAFKITIDTDLTKYPILEFYSGEKVDYTVKRGRIQEVIFYTDYTVNDRNYRLVETFGYGYIKNQLLDERGKEVPLIMVPELAGMQDATFDKSFMMAVPIKFYDSPKWDNRGKSIFDNKTDAFDALDEIISQWIDAIRAGRVQKYIPEDLLPKDPNNGKIMQPNPFDNQFIQLNATFSEDKPGTTTMLQPTINYAAFVESYASAVDVCLQGIISPSTLGMDLKKRDNQVAQREKEKTTLYTRSKLVEVLSEVIPLVINTSIRAYNVMRSMAIGGDLDTTLDFGEYAAPDFENRADTIGKAKLNGIMSVEQCVEQLYGDTWTEEQKAEEVARLKEEQGLTTVDPPAVNGSDPPPGDIVPPKGE